MTDNKFLKISEEFSDSSLSEEDASYTFLAREIVQEIRKFGVNQVTLKKIIELLSLELEDRSTMISVIGAIRGQIKSPESPIFSE